MTLNNIELNERETFLKSLQKFRITNNFSLAKMGSLLGVSSKSLSEWLSGKGYPENNTIERINVIINNPKEIDKSHLEQAKIRNIWEQPIDKIEIGKRLRALRYRKGYTIKGIAKLIGATKNTVSLWELGKVLPIDNLIANIAFEYRTTIEYILFGNVEQGTYQFIDMDKAKNDFCEYIKIIRERLNYSFHDMEEVIAFQATNICRWENKVEIPNYRNIQIVKYRIKQYLQSHIIKTDEKGFPIQVNRITEKMNLLNNIKLIRNNLIFSPINVANKLNISRSNIHRWEKEAMLPTSRNYRRIKNKSEEILKQTDILSKYKSNYDIDNKGCLTLHVDELSKPLANTQNLIKPFDYKTIIEIIKIIKYFNKMSNNDLGKYINISAFSLHYWMKKSRVPKPSIIKKLSVVLPTKLKIPGIYKTSIGERIKYIRINKGLKRNDLAEMLNTTPKMVHDWETGAYLPQSTYFCHLISVLDIKLDDLILVDSG